ncbi:alpha-galactosidase [Nocardioides sp. GCM10027113]|uniref:alpha-galactosidase n=1 Tax=unclassified Nocardioides TaxID=2615069 RepID=UPI00360DADB8
MSGPVVHLTAAGVSVVLAPAASGVPTMLHWGTALRDSDLDGLADAHPTGVSHSALDEPRATGLVPLTAHGYTGTPAVELFRSGAVPVRLDGWSWTQDGQGVVAAAADADLGCEVRLELDLTPEGLLRARTTVVNTGDDGLHVAAVRSTLPVPARAAELLDLSGRWVGERVPQRHSWPVGTWQRAGRHGRTGHDATLLLSAGTPGFAFRRGEVWSIHVAWSGDHESYADRTPEGDVLLGGGELLAPGEVVLGAGESYSSPWLVGGWSGEGLDGVSARFHDLLRRTTPRPVRKVLVNTWEAVYFDHDLDRLTELAEVAAAAGVERFVLDDGWFRGRRDDRAGLGDWTVDPDVWPEGLQPLIERVTALGLDFGLWVEPEMVNLDSDVAREHPDWVLGAHRDHPPEWRHQQVLDLANPAAYDHVRGQLMALLDELDIAYLKWDHNRDLIDVPGARAQTLAFYRLLDELRAAHPGLEIESCASGGGRIDLGVLARTDRVWASDTIDAVERQRIQRWTTLLVPPEMTGAHLGGPVAHTTGRSHALPFRAATALIGHYGIEWDLRAVGQTDRDQVAEWVALHKRMRPLVADGRLVRSDHPDPGCFVTGVVAADGAEGWWVVAQTERTVAQHQAPVLLEGLDPDARYRVTEETPDAPQHLADLAPRRVDVVLTGRALAEVGVRLGVLAPETARVLRATRQVE